MLFIASKDKHFGDIMKVIQLFPKMFSEEDNTNIGVEVTLEELKVVLEGFQKYKISYPDMGG